MSLATGPTFETFTVRHRLTGQLQAETALRVGAGSSLDAANTDQPVMRDGLGRPFLPGSSLKGALRSALEAVIRGLPASYGLSTCDLFNDFDQRDFDPERNPSQRGRPQQIQICGKPMQRPLDAEGRVDAACEVDEIVARSCTVCSLFGSPYLAGRVFFHDLPATHDLLRTEVRDGVGIDRDLGTARPKIKYDVEVVPPGSRFRLDITMENLSSQQLALIVQAIRWLDDGEVLLGGMTTRGLGRVSLHELALRTIEPQDLLLDRKPKQSTWAAARENAERALAALVDSAEAS
ncbi:MAG: CRISPR-associated RAMP protein Csx7 [Acidobacteriota bacterium]